MTSISWGNAQIELVVGIDPGRPVTIDSLDVTGRRRTTPARQPLVELLVLGDGRVLNNTRFTSTGVGDRLRYVDHRVVEDAGRTRLTVDQHDDVTGLATSTTLTAYAGVPAVQVSTTVSNTSADEQIVQLISSLALGCVLDDGESLDDLVLHSAQNSWCAESRWRRVRLRERRGPGPDRAAGLGSGVPQLPGGRQHVERVDRHRAAHSHDRQHGHRTGTGLAGGAQRRPGGGRSRALDRGGRARGRSSAARRRRPPVDAPARTRGRRSAPCRRR